jgi:hypothetical protein
MVKYFAHTLPRTAAEFKARFARKKAILQHFADTEKLGDNKLHPATRPRVFDAAWKALAGEELTPDLIL